MFSLHHLCSKSLLYSTIFTIFTRILSHFFLFLLLSLLFFSIALLYNFCHHFFFKNFAPWLLSFVLLHLFFLRSWLADFCLPSVSRTFLDDFCHLFFSTLLGLISVTCSFPELWWMTTVLLPVKTLPYEFLHVSFLKIIDICHPSHDFSHLPFLILSLSSYLLVIFHQFVDKGMYNYPFYWLLPTQKAEDLATLKMNLF